MIPPAVEAWFQTPRRDINRTPPPLTLDYLAELVAANSGFTVDGWGNIALGGPWPGRHGLTQAEALSLLLFSGALLGFQIAYPPDVYQAILDRLFDRMEQLAADALHE